LPDLVKRDVTVHFAETYDDVYKIAFPWFVYFIYMRLALFPYKFYLFFVCRFLIFCKEIISSKSFVLLFFSWKLIVYDWVLFMQLVAFLELHLIQLHFGSVSAQISRPFRLMIWSYIGYIICSLIFHLVDVQIT
jgi:hypothetical protein